MRRLSKNRKIRVCEGGQGDVEKPELARIWNFHNESGRYIALALGAEVPEVDIRGRFMFLEDWHAAVGKIGQALIILW